MIWLIFGNAVGWRYVKAEAPCWKGEICLGCAVIGWQRARETGAKA